MSVDDKYNRSYWWIRILGRATVERLARNGKRVIVLCRDAERAKYLKPMGDVGQITIIAGNAMNAQTLDDVIASADAVVNLLVFC